MRFTSLLGAALIAATLAAPLCAQGALRSAYVADRIGDDLFLMRDLNGDGDYNDAGESVRYFDSAILGTGLNNVSGVAMSDDGIVYVTSTSSDLIIRMEDLNQDGDANDPGESTTYFDGLPGGNLSGVTLQAAFGIQIDDQGVLWFTNSNSGSGGDDAVFRGEDLNNDGDLNDAGEVTAFYAPPTSGSTGDSLPGHVTLGQDGAVYYLESSGNGFYAKGLYRLDDANNDGSIDPATEVAPFWLPVPPVGASNQFFWSAYQAEDGTWYSQDTLNDILYAYRDDNGDNSIDLATEQSVVWAATGLSNIWQVEVQPNGVIYLTEDQNPDRLLLLNDINEDGVYDSSTETFTIFDENVSANPFSSPRAIVTFAEDELYAGNGSDLAIEVDVDGTPSGNTSVHLLTAGDVVTLNFVSPGGTRDGAPLAAVAQVFNTGSVAAPLTLDPADAPSVYLDLGQPITVILDGLNPAPGALFAPVVGGQSFSATVPVSLYSSGASIMIEAFCADPALNGVGIGNAPSAELRLF